MDDELELSDPNHPEAKEAAASTARLLVHLRGERDRKSTEADDTKTNRKDVDAQPS